MIVDIRKFIFYGLSADLEEFVSRAQEAGFIEFIPPTNFNQQGLTLNNIDIEHAIKSLKKLPVLPAYDRYISKEDLLDKAFEINALNQKLEKLNEELRITEIDITKLKPLGSFNVEDLIYIYQNTGYKMQFFCKPSVDHHEIDPRLIYVGKEFDLDYFVALSKTKLSFPDFIEVKVEQSLNECLLHKDRLESAIKLTEKQLKSMATFLVPLEYALGQFHDLEQLKLTFKMASFPLEASFFTITAYVPKNRESHVPKLLKGLSIQAEVIKPEHDEVLPTCFYNKGFAKSGEDLVKIYDIPSSTDKDPSAWVLWTFALFFAMIISDAGYGFIYLSVALILRFAFKKLTPSAKRSLNLLKILGISCIVWGTLTGSWFGLNLSDKNPLSKITAIDFLVEKKAQYHVKAQDETLAEIQKKFCISNASCSTDILEFRDETGDKPVSGMFSNNILLEISILVGVIHVISSLFRYLGRNWANIGWILFAVGGYLYFPAYLHTASLVQFLNLASLQIAAAFGLQLIYVGIGLSLSLALIQKKLKGLGEIANLVQVFADILSYLRLYALALASSIMAETFNDFGVKMGLFFGVIVILAGHGINFILGTMGGVIHGLRLNFIEWYHYSFDGGGKLFKPLRRFTIKS